MRKFGLIGYPLEHSFSQKYFTQKFETENICDAIYSLFPLENIALFPQLLKDNPDLTGLNVTIPYKEKVIAFLDALDETAGIIGAVNTIHFTGGQSTGYNTDAIGFERSFRPLAGHTGGIALLLGTGGASRAVRYVLGNLGIPFLLVSRKDHPDAMLRYEDLPDFDFGMVSWIINTTPLGTYPHVYEAPDLPYEQLNEQHLVYDLVYNPAESLLLQQARNRGCRTKNGLEMLELQAEAAWEIWNRP